MVKSHFISPARLETKGYHLIAINNSNKNNDDAYLLYDRYHLSDILTLSHNPYSEALFSMKVVDAAHDILIIRSRSRVKEASGHSSVA